MLLIPRCKIVDGSSKGGTVEPSRTDLGVLWGREKGMLKVISVLFPMAYLENNEETNE